MDCLSPTQRICKLTGGDFYLGVCPGLGSGRDKSNITGKFDPLMHTKLYVSVPRKCKAEKPAKFPLELKFPDHVHSAYTGSMNFTGPGLGFPDPKKQSFELLLQADDLSSKQRLADEFHFLWSYWKNVRYKFIKGKFVIQSRNRPFALKQSSQKPSSPSASALGSGASSSSASALVSTRAASSRS